MKKEQISVLTARFALFIIYFWFGLLKIIGQSPASTLVQDLFAHPLIHKMFTIIPFGSSVSPALFVILFGIFEVVIGFIFIIPGKEKVALVLFTLHMITTIMPLFLLSGLWTHIFVPTLEGQYIIKNIALIACALSIWSALPRLRPIDNLAI